MYGVSISVTLPSGPFHRLGAAALSRKPWILLSLFSLSASSLCRPMEPISCVSCSSRTHNAAFRSAPDSVEFIRSSSSLRHSAE